MNLLISELKERSERMKLYGRTYSDWPDFCEEMGDAIQDAYENQEDTYSSDFIEQNYVSIEEYEELKAKLTRKGQTKARQKLLDKIDELESQLSDARADISVYNERLRKGVDYARRAENFIFTPEEARSNFRCLSGGVQ